jgi:hypothetical protein
MVMPKPPVTVKRSIDDTGAVVPGTDAEDADEPQANANNNDEVYFEAMIDTTENILRIRVDSVRYMMRQYIEQDEAPDIATLANMLGTSIDSLRMEYKRCIFKRTGSVVQETEVGLQ